MKKEDMKDSEKTADNALKQGKESNYLWPAISAVLAVLLVASFIMNSGEKDSGIAGNGVAPASADKQQFALQMKSFIQDSLTQNTSEVSIENVTEEGGLYKFNVMINGRLAAVSYATKDGALLFPSALDVEKIKKEVSEATAKAAESQIITKSDIPKVQLFVMSQCPYGVQAENAIKPVLDTLKSKIKFELRFIANRKEDGTFASLHGAPEVAEDLRQVCAMNVYSNYMDYIACRNANIKSDDWQACASKSGMNAEVIKACSEGREGADLLAKNIQAGNDLGIGSSPTILINSGGYTGQRTPDALLGAICSAFNDAPKECLNSLGTNQTQVSEPAHEGCGA